MLEQAALPNVYRRKDDGRGGREGRRAREGEELMSVLVDNDTRLAVAGITGREGSFHTLNNRTYGTNVVGGVNPRKGGEDVEGIPVFADWAESSTQRRPNTAMIFVPPPFAARLDPRGGRRGRRRWSSITEGIPAHDELKRLQHAQARLPEHAPRRPQLPGHPVAGQGERRHHPGVVLQGGQRRRRLALGHADLPDRQRDRPARLRQQLDRRHRRRPGSGQLVHRHHRAVRGRRSDRADRAER